jgi:hypothetical protein
MFLVDDLLLGPGKGALLVFKELARKAQEDWLDDDAIKQELQEIYALAEAGKISSQEFEARECRLLERLEQIARIRFAQKWGHDNGQVVIEAEAGTQSLPVITTEPIVIDTPVIETSTPPSAAAPWAPSVSPSASAREHSSELRRDFAGAASGRVAGSTPASAPWVPSAPPARAAFETPSTPSNALSIGQVVESAKAALALLNLKVSVISSVFPDDGGWRVTAELVERRGVPDTNDQIGVYELRLDAAGAVTRYERTRLRRRGDLGH